MTAPDPGRPTVLIVEDNQLNQMVADGLVRLLGYTADLAENGRLALEALRVRPYEIVLMDLHMPEMDGFEATRRIRAELPAEQQPYIIAVTAAAMAEDKQRCLDAGMDDYVAKPVSKQSMADALARAGRR